MNKKKNEFPEPGASILHPVYGKAPVCLVDTGYANDRGWIHCWFGRNGGFGCSPDEVEIVAQKAEKAQ